MRRTAIADHRSPTPHLGRCASRVSRLSLGAVVEFDFSFCGTPSPIAVGDLRLSGAGRRSTASPVSFGPSGELRFVLKHRFLVFHCTSTTCSSTPVRPTAETTGQRPPMAALRSLLVAARFLSDNVMVAVPDLRDVPPLPLHIWPQVTHAVAGPHARAAPVEAPVDCALFSKGR